MTERMRTMRWLVGVLTIAAVVAAGCAGDDAPSDSGSAVGSDSRASDRGVTDDAIKIGVITVLSGGQEFIGEPPLKTTQAYADDVNARGGINGRMIEVVSYDVCISCPEDGLAAAIKAVENDKVFAILNGFTVNASLSSAVPYLSEHETPMIQTPATAGVDEWAFSFGLRLPHRGAIDADAVNTYLEENDLPKKVALLRFTTALDEEVQGFQRIALERHGIEIVDTESVEYGAGMTDQGSQVAKMQDSGAEMIVGTHGAACAFNMAAAAQRDWDVPYFCTIMYDPFSVQIAGDAAKGRDVLTDSDGFALPDMPGPGVEKFNRVMPDYYEDYGPGLLTMYSFFGMQVFEDAVTQMGDNVTRAGLRDRLAALRDYSGGGLAPPLTVTPTDHTAISGAVILQLGDDGQWERLTPSWVYPDPIHGL